MQVTVSRFSRPLTIEVDEAKKVATVPEGMMVDLLTIQNAAGQAVYLGGPGVGPSIPIRPTGLWTGTPSKGSIS